MHLARWCQFITKESDSKTLTPHRPSLCLAYRLYHTIIRSHIMSCMDSQSMMCLLNLCLSGSLPTHIKTKCQTIFPLRLWRYTSSLLNLCLSDSVPTHGKAIWQTRVGTLGIPLMHIAYIFPFATMEIHLKPCSHLPSRKFCPLSFNINGPNIGDGFVVGTCEQGFRLTRCLFYFLQQYPPSEIPPKIRIKFLLK